MIRYRGDPYWIRCQRPGQCARCGDAIPRGAQAFWYPKGRALYCEKPDCGGKESADFNAAAADEEMYARGYGV